MAKFFQTGEGDLMQTRVGTPYYWAPEILEGGQYDEKADLWSAGIILFQLVSGRVPFQARSEYELRQKVQKGEYSFPEGVRVSRTCAHIIKALIRLDPKQRMGFKEFREHPFAQLEPEQYAHYCIEQEKAV